jgi:hypothetical protein
MAIELGMNRYSRRHEKENPLQHLERRNRERTYLVLWVHDRSLSMQTGRQWMLPEVRSAQSPDCLTLADGLCVPRTSFQ